MVVMDIEIGIIGGMGPKATNQFLDRIVELTDATKDQDHVRYILYSDPEIPNRIDAYFHGKESPVNAINKGIDFLEKNGLTTIAIPCNTAHIWFDKFHKSNLNYPLQSISLPFPVYSPGYTMLLDLRNKLDIPLDLQRCSAPAHQYG